MVSLVSYKTHFSICHQTGSTSLKLLFYNTCPPLSLLGWFWSWAEFNSSGSGTASHDGEHSLVASVLAPLGRGRGGGCRACGLAMCSLPLLPYSSLFLGIYTPRSLSLIWSSEQRPLLPFASASRNPCLALPFVSPTIKPGVRRWVTFLYRCAGSTSSGLLAETTFLAHIVSVLGQLVFLIHCSWMLILCWFCCSLPTDLLILAPSLRIFATFQSVTAEIHNILGSSIVQTFQYCPNLGYKLSDCLWWAPFELTLLCLVSIFFLRGLSINIPACLITSELVDSESCSYSDHCIDLVTRIGVERECLTKIPLHFSTTQKL